MKRAHGTLLFGDEHPSSKLSVDTCVQILRRIDGGEPMSSIARDLGIGRRTVASIRRGKTYNSVEAHVIYAQEAGDPLLGIGL